MTQPFNPSPVFEWNFLTDQPIVVNQGGTSSGKTYSILQALLLKTCQVGASINNLVTTVAGQDMPNLRDGTARELDKILNNEFFGSMIRKVNRSTLKYFFHNGAVLEFKSYDNEQDARNGKRQFLFINEANGVSFEIFEQLQVRTSIQTFLDFNPSAPFWVHHNLIGRADVVRFISNYQHNGYINKKGLFVSNLPASIIHNIEAKKDRPEWWRVYGQGFTGKTSGVVYPNIKWISEAPEIEECKKTAFGLDWGYSNDPSTFVRVSLYEGEIYAEGLLYETGLKYAEIAKKINDLGINLRPFHIVADNDRRGIDTLKDFNIFCTAANKYPGSVLEGIETIKDFKLNIVNDQNWKDEQLSYTYKKDPKTGKPDGNNPKKGNDHYFDALRYAMQKIDFRRGGGGILAKSY
jgi:phage terminase large subunit